MRLKIKLTNNTEPIPINNQHIVNSYIHTCLGRNNKYHDQKSNYCITNIRGGILNDDKQTLKFNNNAHIIVTSGDDVFLNTLLLGITNNKKFGCGMEVNGIDFINEDLYDGYNIFRTLTPILIKEKLDENKYRFATIKDNDYESKLKTYLINKLSKIDSTLDLSNFDVKINNHKSNKTKLILVKDIKNVGSQCDIIIKSNKRVAEVLYNNGIGQSTGSGFGTIYNSKNHHLYYDK